MHSQITSSSSINTKTENKSIDLLFSKFAAFYGHVWRSQFKDEAFFKFAKKEWAEALHEFGDVILNKAILNCREFYEMPPTLPQMIRCCREIRRNMLVYLTPEPLVPAKKEVVALYLKKCKEFLTTTKETQDVGTRQKRGTTNINWEWGYKDKSH